MDDLEPFMTAARLAAAHGRARKFVSAAAALMAMVFVSTAVSAGADLATWRVEWPKTDFERKSVDLGEIFSGGPPKDGIPAIDNPSFAAAQDVDDIGPDEPVIRFAVGDDVRAYPLRILIWHEIVNDIVGGIPVTVTYCPLCNASIVFDRRVGKEVLDFGTTGKLRNSDLVMYDRQTESWWQQFTGVAIVGKLNGTELKMLPSRVESFKRFREGSAGGKVLVPAFGSFRPYGMNPYRGYDTAAEPFMYRGDMPKGIKPLDYVLVVDKEAWPLDLLRKRGRIEAGDLLITWEPGQNSALDAATIGGGRDIGNVVVQRKSAKGMLDVVHDFTFAFVFHAFVKGGVIHKE